MLFCIQNDTVMKNSSTGTIFFPFPSPLQFSFFPFHRHVILPKPIAKWVPFGMLMTEDEWRDLGVMQSPGWVHYMIHAPEPHILLFKRIKNYDTPAPEAPPNFE